MIDDDSDVQKYILEIISIDGLLKKLTQEIENDEKKLSFLQREIEIMKITIDKLNPKGLIVKMNQDLMYYDDISCGNDDKV